MLSANIGDAAIIGAGTDGHNDALAKPVDIRKLCDRLAVHLGLQWVYDTDLPPVNLSAKEEKPSAIRPPEPVHLQDLLALGEIGYIRGIEAKLDHSGRSTGKSGLHRRGTPLRPRLRSRGYADYLNSFDASKGHG